jgi:hypothetical protein
MDGDHMGEHGKWGAWGKNIAPKIIAHTIMNIKAYQLIMSLVKQHCTHYDQINKIKISINLQHKIMLSI